MTSQYERDLWYEHGLRRAIQVLGGNEIASEYPATAATEAERARRQNGHMAWGTKVIDKRYVSLLATEIRSALRSNIVLHPADIDWASSFIVMHTIRGVKQAYVHHVNLHAAQDTLQQAFNDAQLVPNAHVRGQWWVDVGIEVSSPEGLCLQWVTARHDVLASIGLGISVQAVFNATCISCAR